MSTTATNVDGLRLQYVELLKRALTRHEMETATWYTPIHAQHAPVRLRPAIEGAQRLLRRTGLEVVRRRDPLSTAREGGTDWPQSAETMVGLRRLDNLHDCLRQVFADDVPGDILEAGVWRGGASIFMRGVLLAYGQDHRVSWVADSFAGLPAPDPRYAADQGSVFHQFDELAVSVDQVRANFAKYGLLGDRVRFLEGWFEDTLPTAPVDQLCLLRLDGDLYASTIQALDALYAKVVPGGFVVVDDYLRVRACKSAVDDYRRDHGVSEAIEAIDEDGVYWRRS